MPSTGTAVPFVPEKEVRSEKNIVAGEKAWFSDVR